MYLKIYSRGMLLVDNRNTPADEINDIDFWDVCRAIGPFIRKQKTVLLSVIEAMAGVAVFFVLLDSDVEKTVMYILLAVLGIVFVCSILYQCIKTNVIKERQQQKLNRNLDGIAAGVEALKNSTPCAGPRVPEERCHEIIARKMEDQAQEKSPFKYNTHQVTE